MLDETQAARFAQQNGASLLAENPIAGDTGSVYHPGRKRRFSRQPLDSGVRLAAPNTPITVSDVVDLAGSTSMTPISLKDSAIAQFDSFMGPTIAGRTATRCRGS